MRRLLRDVARLALTEQGSLPVLQHLWLGDDADARVAALAIFEATYRQFWETLRERLP